MQAQQGKKDKVLPSFDTVYSVPRLCPPHLSQLLVSKQLNFTINQGLFQNFVVFSWCTVSWDQNIQNDAFALNHLASSRQGLPSHSLLSSQNAVQTSVIFPSPI